MEPCHKIRPWLEWLAADEIGAGERLRVEAHVNECSACRRELADWRSLLAAAGQRAVLAAAACREVDWDRAAEKVMSHIAVAAKVIAMPGRKRMFSPAALATAASLLLMLVAGVFFLTRTRLQDPAAPGNGMIAAASVSHLQAGLAREEVLAYLRQSQLMFTDLLKDCSSEEVAAWEIRLYSRQARELLVKKKYFQQNLPALEWLKVRNVSERIDWLNYEILQLEKNQLCSQIGRLQRIMENEKLLLKIRLLERDLSAQPYQEV